MEEEPWYTVRDRELRAAADQQRAERDEAQRDNDERLRLLVAAIGEYWAALQQEWRRVGGSPIAAVLGPSSWGDVPQIVAGFGGCELIGARGRVKVTLGDDELIVSRRTGSGHGSGYDTGIRLEPDGAGGITPTAEAAVRDILEPLIRQIGRTA